MILGKYLIETTNSASTIGLYDPASQEWLKKATDASKNEKHGGQGLTESELAAIAEYERQAQGASKKIQNIRENAQIIKKGEEHSRTKKR